MPLDYYIFLFVLSYNWYKDAEAVPYLKLAFMPIYKAVLNSKITSSQWRKIENLMEPLKIWQDWDKGKKNAKDHWKTTQGGRFTKIFCFSIYTRR